MGCRTMVSSNQDQAPHLPALSSCQGSVYRLAVDEMQSPLCAMGNPLYAMKSENLSSTESSAEQQQNHAPSSYATSSASDAPLLHGNLNVNGFLCREAMQEAWHEVSQQGDSHRAFDTTLGDFLARAAAANYEGQGDVVVMDPHPFMAGVLDPMVQQRADLLQYQLAASQQSQQLQKKMSVLEMSIPMFNDAVLGDYIESKQKGTSIMPVVHMAMAKSTLADAQPTGMMEVKQQSDGAPLDKNYERKQKRMIKNRESAARSRAKKQAYINQLEREVVELKQTNKCLKRQNEVDSLKRPSPSPPKWACQEPFGSKNERGGTSHANTQSEPSDAGEDGDEDDDDNGGDGDFDEGDEELSDEDGRGYEEPNNNDGKGGGGAGGEENGNGDDAEDQEEGDDDGEDDEPGDDDGGEDEDEVADEEEEEEEDEEEEEEDEEEEDLHPPKKRKK